MGRVRSASTMPYPPSFDEDAMSIGYLAPFDRAWKRMRVLLFEPVQPGVWLLLGVAAFLGGGQYGRFSFTFPWRDDVIRGPESFLPFLLVFGPLLLLLGLASAWIFSRGAFVFLDDVLHSRVEIAEPWKRFARQGNSLFLWKLGFGAV